MKHQWGTNSASKVETRVTYRRKGVGPLLATFWLTRALHCLSDLSWRENSGFNTKEQFTM
jgi:hypothetical protein